MTTSTVSDMPEHVSTQLGALVRDRAAHVGKSYREVSRDAGVSIATVSKIVHGRLTHVPGPRVLEGLAHALAINVTQLKQAAAHDIGLREYVVSDARRQAITISLADLDDAELDAVQQIVDSIRQAHRPPPEAP